MTRRVVGWSIVPLCLFLAVLGMRVPHLASATSAPKPRPRAVIESPGKASQDAAAKKVAVAADLCPPLPPLRPPALFRTSHKEKSRRYRFVTLPRLCARAPPVSIG